MHTPRWATLSLGASLVAVSLVLANVSRHAFGPRLYGEQVMAQAYGLFVHTLVGSAMAILLFVVGTALSIRHRRAAGVWPRYDRWLIAAVLVFHVTLGAVIVLN